ncbi:MAG: ATPase [Caulobacter sp.]|nr:ATPase [Caulobacter sp.]
MRLRYGIAALAMAMAGFGQAQAEVVSTTEGRLLIRNVAVISAPPSTVYEKLGQIGSWWESSHTYSGKASNMTIRLEPGGCFCEALAGGGVKHGEVVLAIPGQTLRILGALGPLQDLGAAAALTFQLKALPDGTTEVTQTYQVGGLDSATFKIAPIIDRVLAAQLKGLERSIEATP